eukprot:303467_1
MFSLSKASKTIPCNLLNLRACFLVIMMVSMSLWIVYICSISLDIERSVHSVYDRTEKYIKKTWIIHDFGTYLIDIMVHLSNDSYLDETIFFIHIPRTALDTIQMTLVGASDDIIDHSKWTKQYAPFHDAYIDANQWKHAKVVKGFLSWNQIAKYDGNKKICIVLRHPLERLLSLYHLLNDPLRLKRLFDIDHALQWMEFVNHSNQRVQSFVDNAMVWHCIVCGNITQRTEHIACIVVSQKALTYGCVYWIL